MKLEPNDIHIWTIHLNLSPEQENAMHALLSPDEVERADNFRFPNHRQRFVAARGALRQIIALYLNTSAKSVEFGYTNHDKPYIKVPTTTIQFNLTHSHDLAVCALTLDHPIGVDIERVQLDDKSAVAKRFFSRHEVAELANASTEERRAGFYRIWSRKEAVIKAIGKGLAVPLSSFSVKLSHEPQCIELENNKWHLYHLTIAEGYQSAVATDQEIEKITYCDYFEHFPQQED